MASPLARSLSVRVNVAPGSFLGREVWGLPGPLWSMIAWYLIITGLMLSGILNAAISTNDAGTPGLAIFRFAYCIAGVLVLVWLGLRTPGWVLFLLVDLNIAVACLAAASRNDLLTQSVPLATLVFAALYASTWFGKREMLVHLSLLTALSALVVFISNDTPALRVLWAALIVLCWALGFFVNTLVRDFNRQVMRDPLTALLNRTGLDLVVANLSQSRAQVLPRSVVVLDLDDFKAFNDRDGHHAGDELLRAVGVTLRSQLRARDIPARTGGDEFVVLLPATSVEDARLVLARVVAALPIGCSVGVTDWPAGSTFDEAVRGADREMYTHKRRHDL